MSDRTKDENALLKICLASGGTGGHMMPAAALSDQMVKRGYSVSLITDPRGNMFDKIMTDIPRTVLNVNSHARGGMIGKVRGILSILSATLKVWRQFGKDRPDAVVGFGGYPSLPTVLAARLRAIPYVVHEQNAVLGRVNKLVGKRAAYIALGMYPTSQIPIGARTEIVGNPVRPEIKQIANVAYTVPIGFGDIRVLVIGGSQGARILSDNIPAALGLLDETMRERLVVAHQAREADIKAVEKAYQKAGIRAEVASFFNDMGGRLVNTHLVIARSGASTLAEIQVAGRPAILVPLRVAAHDHQLINARISQRAGGAWIVEEKQFTPENMVKLIRQVLSEDLAPLRDASTGIRSLGMPDADARLADLIEKVVERRRRRAAARASTKAAKNQKTTTSDHPADQKGDA